MSAADDEQSPGSFAGFIASKAYEEDSLQSSLAGSTQDDRLLDDRDREGVGEGETNKKRKKKKKRPFALYDNFRRMVQALSHVFSLDPVLNVTYSPVSDNDTFGVLRMYLKVSVWRGTTVETMTDLLQRSYKAVMLRFSGALLYGEGRGILYHTAVDLVLGNREIDDLRMFRGYRPLTDATEGTEKVLHRGDQDLFDDDDGDAGYSLAMRVRSMRDCEELAKVVVYDILNDPQFANRNYENSSWFAHHPPVNVVFVANLLVDVTSTGLPTVNRVTRLDF